MAGSFNNVGPDGADDAAASNRRLSLHIEKTPLAVIEWNSNFEVVRWNPAAERIFGYTQAEALGRHAMDLVVPESARGHVDRVWRDLIANRGGATSTNENTTKDGRRVVCEWHNTPLVTDDGRVVGVASFVQDVTQQKRTEEALRQSEERYRVLVDTTADHIYSYDRDGRFTGVNEALRASLGRAADQVIGRTDLELGFSGPAADRWQQLKRRVLATGEVQDVEIGSPMPDGQVHTYQAVLRPVRDAAGQIIGIRGMSRDITERKRLAEERERLNAQVAEREELLNAIVNSIPEGIALLRGPDFRFELVNSVLQNIDPETVMLGRPFAEAHPELASLVLPVLEETVAGEKPRGFVDVPFDVPAADPSGPRQRRFVSFSYAPIRFPSGQPSGVLVTATDTTERVLLEEQFRQAQKMEAIGRLAGGIAHDFNNLLTAILGYCELVVDELGEDHPARVDVEQIRDAGNSAATLTRQLLAFSRKQILQPALHDMNEIVAANRRLLQRVLGEDIAITEHLGAKQPTVRVDRGQIEQVLMNLTVNARDAMPRGGSLTIETANVMLDESYAQMHVAVTPGPYVMLAVSDTGHGMTPEVKARLFEPFFTTKEPGRGTGLGLATVYGIVKQSGGNIWTYSESGHGTTFKVYLPQVQESPEAAVPAPAALVAGGHEIILLVEDDERLRELARKALVRDGYSVLAAPDPATALELSERHESPIALLLTDVVLPQMSGRILAERLLALRPHMRVLYMSGYTDNAIVHHGVLDRATAFLQKPFTPAALTRKVREVLGAPAPRQAGPE
ncbi:MAG: PAS domain S-box protein [Acidobacteria bacterium]|nr:PAS domain S-box protein [Acidobacteriota bacterium]